MVKEDVAYFDQKTILIMRKFYEKHTGLKLQKYACNSMRWFIEDSLVTNPADEYKGTDAEQEEIW